VVDLLVVWGGGIPEDVNLRALGERRRDLTVDAVYGTRDRWIAAESVEAERAMLEASGVEYRMRPFNGGHSLSRAVLRELMTSSVG
jgi:predicted esterase